MNDFTIESFKENNTALFKNNGLQEKVLDSYKFTNVNKFFEGILDQKNSFKGDIPSFAADLPTITFKNGILASTDKLPEGIIVKGLKEHFSEIKDLLQDRHALSSLHHSQMSDGIILEVAKKVEIQSPIRILNIVSNAGVNAPTHLIIANPFSKITIIEENRGLESIHAVVSETYIKAETGSKVEHITLDQESDQGLIHGSIQAEVSNDATVKSFIFHTSGKMSRKNLSLNLNASGANGESYALYLTEGQEHSDINTEINHRAPDTTSNQLAKGILDGESKGVFTGKIHIFPKAQRVASGQLNKNLLLSNKSQVHSQPQLEIFADDVKCSHGSTTGQLSDDEVFYLEARGIPAERARSILALGFGLEVVQKIENLVARDRVSTLIKENLERKFKLGGIL